ncbi:hypothetical protein CHLRE_04g225650v5 [Chlamydomonas reinhardtii]|uniref:Uncharacterized protein n=1 Tax=Chlamydomonas reinhardtii TaxID=3055 RepID=A8IT67_CHLRE|nr:uncharacterized protein CHLRE_04g225650v5 [Chlamydomonas reinhardtii]PNW84216.1 hypothetical protein CHLRE_04g225650v5 [Chlamydomonas reinhardtii]|eukprot:XP_001692321.1 predicted protein [Chlamydomonas reinhardtii]
MAKRVLIALAAFVMLNAATATIVGGSSKAAVSDPDVVHAANFVVSSANTNACSGLCAGLQKEGELKLVKVLSASTQVVAGVNVHLELLMADDTGKQTVVTSTVWSRPWLASKNDAAQPATQITALTFKPLDGTLE